MELVPHLILVQRGIRHRSAPFLPLGAARGAPLPRTQTRQAPVQEVRGFGARPSRSRASGQRARIWVRRGFRVRGNGVCRATGETQPLAPSLAEPHGSNSIGNHDVLGTRAWRCQLTAMPMASSVTPTSSQAT
jgi:hypothetical protein